MNNWQLLINDPFIQTIGWTLVHSIWQGALIAVLLSFVLGLLWKESANSRYISSIGAMMALLICLGGTFIWQYQKHHSIQPNHENESGISNYMYGEEDLAETSDGAIYLWETLWKEQVEPFLQANMPLLVFCWLFGAVILTIKFIGGYFYLYRLSHFQLKPLPQSWNKKIKRLSDQTGLRRAVRVFESALVDEPLTLRHLKPIILLPVGLISGLSADQVEAIILHEMAHIRRADYLINLIQSIIEIVLFYHPAVWWISGRIRQTREESCDDLVMQTGRDVMTYAEALTTIQSFYRSPKPMLTMTAIGKKGHFTARIQRLFGQHKKQNSAGRSLLSILVIFACLATLAFQDSHVVAEKNLFTKENAIEKIQPFNSVVQPLTSPTTELSPAPAPEEIQETTPVAEKRTENIRIYIDANTSEAELKALQKKLKAKDIELTVDYTYTKGKLTSISGTINFPEGGFGNFNVNGENLYVSIIQKEDKGFKIQTGHKDDAANEWIEVEPVVEGVEINPNEETEVEVPQNAQLEPVEKENEFKIRISPNSPNNEPLFIIDGVVVKEKGKAALQEIDPKDIETVNVLKGESAIDSYGSEGENGVIVITTKMKNKADTGKEEEFEVKPKIKKDPGAEKEQKLMEDKLRYQKQMEEKKAAGEKAPFEKMGDSPLYIVNGKEIGRITGTPPQTIRNMMEEGGFTKADIETINFYDPILGQELYGNKGQDGAVVLNLKSNKTSVQSQLSDNTFAGSVKAYPNPLSEKLTVDFSLEEPAKLQILVFDINGRKIYGVDKKYAAGAQTFTYNMKNSPAGVYTIHVVKGEETVVKKVVKE
ncbi:MAG: M56 family metallopeptidase [Bacteroidia bacterium]